MTNESEVPNAMEVECIRIIRSWSTRLNSEMSEVKKLLKNEGMVLESAFLEQGSQGDFLIYYLRAADIKRTKEIARISQVMAKIVESSVRLECLFDAHCEE